MVCHKLWLINEKEWESATEEEQQAMMDECFTYDDELKKNGHFVVAKGCRGLKMPPY
jgi:hypothetical protein